LNYFNGLINATLRQRLQDSIFSHYLRSDWSGLQDFRLGDSGGTNTQEATVTAKYLISSVTLFYFALGALALAILKLLTGIEITLSL